MSAVSGNLLTSRVNAGHRTYFINVVQSVSGARYLQINESRRVGEGQYEQSRIFVPEEHIEELCDSIREAANFLATLPPVPARHPGSAPAPFRRTDEPWSAGEEVRLRRALDAGHSVEEIAHVLLRHPDAVAARLAEMGPASDAATADVSGEEAPLKAVQNAPDGTSGVEASPAVVPQFTGEEGASAKASSDPAGDA